MAESIKSDREIERCLKKSSKGIERLDRLWEKVDSATDSDQKEKYEAKLEKQIKKLQRLQDQILPWFFSNNVKDKRTLPDIRILQFDVKFIERQIKKFNIVEPEIKTGAYSEEELLVAKKEKEDIITWLACAICALSIQADQLESETESLNFSLKKKKSNKKKLDRLDELKTRLRKHRHHINQLEALLRMLDNSTVKVEQIKKIKDDVEYYIESSQDPDFEENEFIYDNLNLENMDEFLDKQRAALIFADQQNQFDCKNTSADEESSIALSNTPTSTNSNSPIHSPGLTNHSKAHEEAEWFDMVESETETEAYSDEDLGAAQTLDPAQKDEDILSRLTFEDWDVLYGADIDKAKIRFQELFPDCI